nr:replication protein A 70 kDa DNA-binding subunit B-like isoform X1 [Ipomoea batatas]
MVRKLLISYVSPGEKDWSCKVCVVKKLDAQDSKTTPGVMAIVIHKLPRKHVDSKNGKIDAADFVLVDEQAKPVIFTLWGKYAQVEGVELEKQLTIGNFPVILAKNVEVTNYSCMYTIFFFHFELYFCTYNFFNTTLKYYC